MMEFIFLDLDNTILDFDWAERQALQKALAEAGISPSEQICRRYHEINQQCWQRLERGEWSRRQVLDGRFRLLFAQLGTTADPVACSRSYEQLLGEGHRFLPGAQEALRRLHGRYRLFLASNGTAHVQNRRLQSAGLYPLFENVFISEKIGADKPSSTYFARCFDAIPNFNPARAIMVGDSLTSDILGGKNAGIATCWVNPKHETPTQIRADYEITCLAELEPLLEEL